MQDFRVIDLPERTTLDASDYAMIDSANNGTNKYLLSRQAAETDAKIATAVSGVEEELGTAVEGIEESITALQGDMGTVETTLGTKADVNGTYPEMAVGSVLGTNTVTNTEPYFSRPSASIGDREFDTLVGGSLGWNQLVSLNNISSETINDVTFTVNNDGTVVVNGTATALTRKSVIFVGFGAHNDVGHKLYYWGCPSGGSADGYKLTVAYIGDTTQDTGSGAIWSIPDTQYTGPFSIQIAAGTVCNNLVFKPQCIDLTTLFGATIADYIYSLEQAHAGDGVAWVRKYLPNTYYAYCAPTLKHVTGVSAHVMRDANNNVIGNYAIDSTWVGMGIPKLDSDNKLYFDGDTYASDGTVTERYRELDITADMVTNVGTSSTGIKWAYVSISDHNGRDNSNVLCTKYPVYPSTAPTTSGWVRVTNMAIYFFDDAFTDLATAKTLLAGTKIVYELVTPTTSTASPYTNPQICDPSGTEEYVSTGLVPVGHETEYVENLADKLTDIPDLPTTAGTYSLKVTVSGGVPSYSWVSA